MRCVSFPLPSTIDQEMASELKQRGAGSLNFGGFSVRDVRNGPAKAGYQPMSVDAELATGGSGIDPTAGLRDLGLPIRQIDLTGGIEFQQLMNVTVTDKQAKYGWLIGWARLLLAGVYGVTSFALLFVVIFLTNGGKMPLQWDPLRYSNLDNKWEAALEKVGVIYVAWALLAMLTAFAAYQAVHFLPVVREFYLKFVSYYQMNPIRWIWYGVAGGLVVAFYSLIMGVSSVIVMVLLLVIVIGGAASVLFSEMINRPNVYIVTDAERQDPSILTSKYGLTPCEAAAAIKVGYFLKPGVVTPWPILAALVLLLTYVGIVSAYFWTAVDDEFSQVPWYAWTTYFLTVASFVAMAAANVARLLLSWALFQNYLYLDLLHNGVEFLFIYVGIVLNIVGFAVAA